MDKATKLVLFDIDGTLLISKGIGRRSIKEALISSYGTGGSIDTCDVGGRSYLEIVKDALSGTGVTNDQITQKWVSFNQQVLDAFRKNLQEDQGLIVPLPGGIRLVNTLCDRPGMILGLITGNPAGISWLKLKAAGYKKEQFKINVFGDEATTRSGLVTLARQRAFRIYGNAFPGKQTIIIGDTLKDVACAHQSNARSIIVLTGYDTQEILKASRPDFIFNDLTDTESIEKALFAPI